jgi:heme o synthase
MTNDCIVVELQASEAQRRRTKLSEYWLLSKPEVNFLILIATFTGFYMAVPPQRDGFPITLLLHTMLGTLLVASGAAALNQYVERRFDAEMRRTRNRPLVAGTLVPFSVLWFGIFTSLGGSVYLALAVDPLASLLSLLTLTTYLFVYTPLKRRTPGCTFIGAFPGAMPILIGWAAASGKVSVTAWPLFALLFLWQFPHFMAIAWIYSKDYARAGYLVLPSEEHSSRFMSWTVLVTSTALVLLSLAPAHHAPNLVLRVAGLIFSGGYCYYSVRLAIDRTTIAARRLLTASIIYLPLALLLTMLGK